MAAIVLVMFAVIIAASLTFTFAQKKVTYVFFSQNMEAMAKSEGGTDWDTCYKSGENVVDNGKYHCAAGTTYGGSSGHMEPCSGCIKPTWLTDTSQCTK